MKILLVEDDLEALESTKRMLEISQFEVDTATSGMAALEILEKSHPDLIVTDVRMPGMSGMEFVESFQKTGRVIPFIVMTAFGQVNDAVWAMKMGAVDFLQKPFKKQTLLDAIQQVSVRLSHQPKSGSPLDQLIGSSRKMRELKVLIEQVAKTTASVLVLGESGTGKEQVARLIHELGFSGNAKNKPFVAINCAAIPENLLESELFGYERGAFSGATQAKAGLFEAAQGGTLLLDEIGDMPLSLQPKLLRVLEEQKVRRLGANIEKTIDVRIIAATHQNLAQQVASGRFRQDLFYRLDVMSLQLPPLRDRAEDIPELTQYLLSQFAKSYQKNIRGIDTEAQAILMSHPWPGNVRELANALERATVLTQDGLIRKSVLPLHLLSDNSAQASSEKSNPQEVTIPLGMSLKEIEDLMIQKALVATGGDRAQAAKMLGVNERTIYRRIHKSKEAEE